MPFVEASDGAKLFYTDLGSGTPIVLVHGWPLSGKQWEYQQTVLPEQGFRVVSPDLRGYGMSDAPWGKYDYDTFADDLHTLLEKLQLNDITLVGFSMGGAIALNYMTKYSGQHVSKLVFAGAAAPSYTKRPGFDHGVDPKMLDTIIAGLKADRAKANADFGKMFFGSKVSEEFSQYFFSVAMAASAWATIADGIVLRDADLRAALSSVHVPTLIMHGKKDKIVPYELGEVLHKSIAGSKLVTFDDSGHGLFYDEKDKFNKELAEFAK